MAPSTSLGSITCSLVIVIFAVCFGSNFQFYSNSVTNNLAVICQHWINQSYFHRYGSYVGNMNLLWSLTSASLQFGALNGALFTRFLADKFGRRKALMISSTMSMSGAVLDAFSKLADSFEMFILGRYLIGLALGSGLALASIFIIEIAPVTYRGACGSAQQMFVGLGNLVSFLLSLSQVMGTEELWPIAVSLFPFAAGATQFLVLLFFAYDSPRHLILSRNDERKGLASIKFYQGDIGAENRLISIEDERNQLQDQENKKFRFIDLFLKREIRRPLVIALMIIFGAQMSGIAAVLAYSKTMFVNAGLDDQTAQFASCGIGLCNFLSPILAMFLIERAGRKPIFLAGLCSCDVMLILLSISVYGSNANWPGANIATVPCLYLFQLGFALANSIVLIAPAELFPQKARAFAMTVVFCFSWFLQLLCVLAYLPFSSWVGVEYSYIPFIVSVSISIVILAVRMPETKGKTVEQVAAMFASKSVYDSSMGKDIITQKF